MGLRDFDLGAAADDWTECCLGNGPSLVVFLVLNAAVFFVGVSFYVHSDPTLSGLPTLLCLFFGDSPATLAPMTLSAVALFPNLGRHVADASINRPFAHLHTLAFVRPVKYGVWMVVALNLRPGLYVGFPGAALWDYWGIMPTHAGFLALAPVVPRYGATTKGTLGFALALVLANDVFDYGLDYYPPLKYEAGVLLTGITVAPSFLTVFLASRTFNCLPDATETVHERPTSHNH